MKCDHCDKPAVVHEVLIKNGRKKEVHLCEEHATAAGYAVPTHQPINQLLTQFTGAADAPAPQTRKPQSCPNCGLTFARFRSAGVLGCPECYECFCGQLEPLIEKAQAGAVSHVGKVPGRGGGDLDLQLLRQRLVRELDEAVAAEQYERAAKLRDQLLTLPAGGASDDAAAAETDDP